MKQSFEDRNGALNSLLKNTCDSYIFIEKGKERTGVGIKGNTPDLLWMMRHAYEAIHSELEKKFGVETADRLCKTIVMSYEEMDKEIASMKEEVEEKIPEWLLNLLRKAEEEIDSTDETDSEEDEEADDDDEGSSPDISVRVDLHHHHDDGDRE